VAGVKKKGQKDARPRSVRGRGLARQKKRGLKKGVVGRGDSKPIHTEKGEPVEFLTWKTGSYGDRRNGVAEKGERRWKARTQGHVRGTGISFNLVL